MANFEMNNSPPTHATKLYCQSSDSAGLAVITEEEQKRAGLRKENDTGKKEKKRTNHYASGENGGPQIRSLLDDSVISSAIDLLLFRFFFLPRSALFIHFSNYLRRCCCRLSLPSTSLSLSPSVFIGFLFFLYSRGVAFVFLFLSSDFRLCRPLELPVRLSRFSFFPGGRGLCVRVCV